MSTDDGKRLAQLHDAMQDRIRELEDALRNILEEPSQTAVAFARYVIAKGNRR